MIVFILALLFAPQEKQIVWTDSRVIVQCDCRWKERGHVQRFVRCMRGPPYLCGPAYAPRNTPPYQYWWMNLPPSPRPYVCINSLVECWPYDRDFDGDVDLHDLALWTVENWGPGKIPFGFRYCLSGEYCDPSWPERVCYGWDGDVRYERNCSDPVEPP